MALPDVAAMGDAKSIRVMLDHGAEVDAFDPLGRTPLMYAVASDALPLDVVKLLVERGADVNAKDRHKQGGDSGLSVLDIAKLHGKTPIVDFLVKAGAKEAAPAAPALKPRRENTIGARFRGVCPLLQRADANFMPKAACVSCHNNSIAAMAVSAARKSGFAVDEKIAAQQVKGNAFGLEKLRDYLRQGFFTPVGEYFGPVVMSYILVGLDAEHYPADLNTDAVAMYLKGRQSPDGSWAYPLADTRPPICTDYIGQTALSMRALQLYAPKVDKAGYEPGDSAGGGVDREGEAYEQRRSGMEADGPGVERQGPGGEAEGIARLGGDAAVGRRMERPGNDGERRVCDRTGAGCPGDGRHAGDRCGVCARHPVPLEDAAGRRVVVRADARDGFPAAFRCRLPARVRPVDLGGGVELGDDGAFDGCSGEDSRKRGNGRRRSVGSGGWPV